MISQLIVLESGYALLDWMIEDEFDLKFVLMVGVGVAEVPELFGLVKTPVKVLRGDEVLSNLYAIVNVVNLQNW